MYVRRNCGKQANFHKETGSFWLVAEIGLQHCGRSQIIKFICGSSIETFQCILNGKSCLLLWNRLNPVVCSPKLWKTSDFSQKNGKLLAGRRNRTQTLWLVTDYKIYFCELTWTFWIENPAYYCEIDWIPLHFRRNCGKQPNFHKKTGSFWLVAEIGLQHCDRSQIIKFIFGSSLEKNQLEILLIIVKSTKS